MSEIRGLSNITPQIPTERLDTGAPAAGFKDLLKDKLIVPPPAAKADAPQLKFSNHAVDRMKSRGIWLEEGDMTRISEAVDKAASKGSKETLVLMGESAFIVNVKNKTVVTAMDSQQMKENVFTNIDSTVIL